ncbi:MAG: hypothetical protein ABJN40_06725 [Sneathiella sp.]
MAIIILSARSGLVCVKGMLARRASGRYTDSMSEKPTLDALAERYFYLWQQQVTSLAQSPDSSFADLMAEGQRIARDLAPDIRPDATSPEDETDLS